MSYIKRLLLPIPEVFGSRGSRLRHERGPRRDLRKSLRVTIVDTQIDLSKVLLAHHAKRCPDLCQSLRQMPKIGQYHKTAIRRVDPYDSPMDVRSVGLRHYRATPNGGATVEVPGSGHRLLHEMGGS